MSDSVKKFKRFRMIVPSFPNAGIFSRFTRRITSLGAVIVATIVDKCLPNWTAEIIDENNYRKGPCLLDGSVDHAALQKEAPADAVGFYCGLSSTMPRVWRLAEFYKSQGILTIAGGCHVCFDPQESLARNIDVVIDGDGEEAILDILKKWDAGMEVKGAVEAGLVDLNGWPAPDFGLLRFAKINIYPIGRIRGCAMKCEFCCVKEKPRWAQAEQLFQTINWLVDTRRAKSFFVTDDRIEEDREGYIQFFQMIREKYGSRLRFTVQVRLEAARDAELIEAMKMAGVRHVCIGFESPIKEELLVMRKGLSVESMIENARIWSKNFFVHGMFIFGYPLKQAASIPYNERIRQFKRFIRKCRIDTIQILRPAPLIGTELRRRLEESGQLFPLETVGWERYDGNFACFRPTNMTLRQLQYGPTKIMLGFYHWWARIRLPFRTVMMPFSYLVIGWGSWYRGWWNDVVKVGGHRLLKKWKSMEEQYLKSLEMQ
ncbi:MAG: radical SAM protein [Candidatus Omnitrophota bacterium]